MRSVQLLNLPWTKISVHARWKSGRNQNLAFQQQPYLPRVTPTIDPEPNKWCYVCVTKFVHAVHYRLTTTSFNFSANDNVSRVTISNNNFACMKGHC